MTINDIVNKHCLIGLSYFNTKGELLKQSQLCGKVIKVDAEEGISVELLPGSKAPATKNKVEKKAIFILPPTLSSWFTAPKGTYTDSETGTRIIDPEFLVTWDINQTKEHAEEGQHEWWDWQPRTTPPQVGN